MVNKRWNIFGWKLTIALLPNSPYPICLLLGLRVLMQRTIRFSRNDLHPERILSSNLEMVKKQFYGSLFRQPCCSGPVNLQATIINKRGYVKSPPVQRVQMHNIFGRIQSPQNFSCSYVRFPECDSGLTIIIYYSAWRIFKKWCISSNTGRNFKFSPSVSSRRHKLNTPTVHFTASILKGMCHQKVIYCFNHDFMFNIFCKNCC